MSYRWLFSSKVLLAVPLLLILVLAVACGDDAEPTTAPTSTSPAATPTSPAATATAPAAQPSPTAMAPEVGVQGGVLTVALQAWAESFDPHIEGTINALNPTSPLYNQVVEYNPISPTEIIGDLAESWESSDDGMTFTFTLRDGMKWWDGEDLDADDVAFSINRMIEIGEPRPRVGLLRPSTKNAEMVDKLTVKVDLNYPSVSFIEFLAVDYMKIVAKHVVEAGTDINIWENIMGSGPFMTEDIIRGNEWKHTRNPDYFKEGRPFFDQIIGIVITDPDTIGAAFKAGKFLKTSPNPPMDLDAALILEQDLVGQYSVQATPRNTALHIPINVQKSPFNDLRVGGALRLATDQVELQQAFGGGRYTYGAPFQVGSWFGHTEEGLAQLPGYGGIPGSTRTKQDDIDAAVALLKDAGYDPPSALGKIVLTTCPALWFADLAQLWAQQMRRNLELDMEAQIVDCPTAVRAQTSGEFDVSLWGYAVNISVADDYVNAIYGPGARNYTGHATPEFLDLFNQQSREADRAKRTAILREMEDMLLAPGGSPYIELTWSVNFWIVSDKIRTEVGGWVAPDSMQTILKEEHIWLEDE